ncbi:MAG TPA: hypothetical protein VIK18_16825 [Pirellulales bacterium]
MAKAYEIASSRVAEYDSAMRAHLQAVDCFDCEDRLLLGIEAFRWIESAQQAATREMAAKGFSQQTYDTVTELYRRWLRPCANAMMSAEQHVGNSFEIRYLEEFKRSCRRAEAFLAAVDHEQLCGTPVRLSVTNSEALRALTDKQAQ